MKRPTALGFCAWFTVALSLGTVRAEHPYQGVEQKDGIYQKGGPEQKGVAHVPPPKHHRWCPTPPPMGPILEPVSVLRVAGPVRRVQFRLEQATEDQPAAEAGLETDSESSDQKIRLDAMEESIKSLDARVTDLYDSMKMLVEKLGQ
jgi:hypothetical protein